LLYLTGGAANPFTGLFLLQVVLGAVLLEAWAVWAMVVVTVVCFAGLSFIHRPLVIPPDGPDPFSLYIRGALMAFTLSAVLLVILIGRINANLRRHDAQLAALRQRAAEEDHIVRMGLLASGAAHELGTPLATLDVILGDWRRMPKVAKDAELSQEVEEMRAEVARCKTIVTGVLASAGEARPEAAGASGLKAYLRDVFEDWRRRRGPVRARYDDQLPDGPVVVADSALRQAIHNLLDNALEASPGAVQLSARLEGEELRLQVQDEGAGFAAQVLASLGKPYNSTKGRPGGGLGLFLAANVARKLGGRLEARNREAGGAEVTLSVPVASLAMEAAA
jgi:two-component system sensor histidine kinase RegB